MSPLLIPIADVPGITVTELLQGEKAGKDQSLYADETENPAANSPDRAGIDFVSQDIPGYTCNEKILVIQSSGKTHGNTAQLVNSFVFPDI